MKRGAENIFSALGVGVSKGLGVGGSKIPNI